MAAESDYLRQARKYEKKMVHFLRDMIAIPSESCRGGESDPAHSGGNGKYRRV